MINVYELRFHTRTRRWRVYRDSEMLYPLHCGDGILIQIGQKFLPTHVELDTEWYVRFGETKFWLHRKTRYLIQPIF